MNRPKSPSLIDQLLAPAAKPEVSQPAPVQATASAATPAAVEEVSAPPKKSDPLPRPGDAYRAYAQYLNRLGTGERLLHFVDKDCFSVGYCYADLRRVSWQAAAEPGGGPVLVLIFASPSLTEVRISGRNLEEIRYYIGEGMLPWVWEQPRGFRAKDDQMAAITAIAIKEIER